MIPNLTPAERAALAKRAVYTGSAEHKDRPSWLGAPHARRNPGAGANDHRQNSTICPLVREEDKAQATEWVQQAIRHRHFDPTKWDGDFPRDIWHQDEHGVYWQGRLTQRGAGDNPQGEYKGWPITEDEWNENFH
jgi:hypothetical protein